MSVLNQSGEEQVECPLCMEPLEVDDLHFYPCTCGYQICRFCWNRIREGENGLCPACRKAYPENPADFTPLSQEQVAAIKTEKKAREAKRRNKTLESRRALANVRVVQNNLVFVVGLPVRLADPEILKRQEYFGKYGKIHKVVINQSPAYAGSQQVPSASAYVTYVSPADALRAIQGVNNATLDGRVLKGSLGTTKYCANFMKNQPCPKPDCMYLHELGDPKASFTKEEMHAGLHQVYERRLHTLLAAHAARELERAASQPTPTPTPTPAPNASANNPANSANSASPAATGNSSSNAEKGSSKDGNNSNFIPTTVVTSSHINVVSTSKSRKDSVNGNISNGNGNGNGNSNSNGNGGKEAWPSLGSSPPSDSPARKQASPKPQQTTAKSQENGTSESSSPTQLQTQQSQTKNSKENHIDSKPSRNNKDSNTSSQNSKKNKENKKQKNSNSTTSTETSESDTIETKQIYNSTQNSHTTSSVFESDSQQSYLTNELDELESDRHSLLENHDLLDNSDHSLLEDDDTHHLLNDANNEVLMLQRHREMLAGLVDNNHLLPHMKTPLVNGYSLLDREASMYLGNDRQISQINQGLLEKEMLMRERNRSSMLLRQNDMLRQHMVEPKHYMPTSSIGLDSASELLGANYHPNPNMLPPFGMRVDNSTANAMSSNTLASSLSASSLGSSGLTNSLGANMVNNSLASNSLGNTLGNTMAANSLGANTLATNSMGGNVMANSMGVSSMGGGYMMHSQQLLQQNQQQMAHSGLVNGFDAPQSNSEGRYLAENMDKFFTDFHKAQQMRLLVARDERRYEQLQQQQQQQQQQHYPHNMLSAERLEMEHKQRMNNMRAMENCNNGGRAAGDGDDDLDFDPFKETQKALAEMMETEMMLNTISSGDNLERVRRARLAPPGFAHVNAFAAPPHHHQGYNNTNSAIYSDWTQMDPAIMSTSVNFGKGAAGAAGVGGAGGAGVNVATSAAALSQQQQELFARFNQLSVHNGVTKLPGPGVPTAVPQQLQQQWGAPKLQWGAYTNVPLPPGFAPAKPPQRPAECIDAK